MRTTPEAPRRKPLGSWTSPISWCRSCGSCWIEAEDNESDDEESLGGGGLLADGDAHHGGGRGDDHLLPQRSGGFSFGRNQCERAGDLAGEVPAVRGAAPEHPCQ